MNKSTIEAGLPEQVTVNEQKADNIPSAQVSANAMLAGVIGYDTSNQPIIPSRNKLTVKTNAHPNCDGTALGWIEGCSLNICWSNENGKFDKKKADELVRSYNAR